MTHYDLDLQKRLAKSAYELAGIRYLRTQDGNIFLSGELVATYEGIIP